jgi:hypothetical protein
VIAVRATHESDFVDYLIESGAWEGVSVSVPSGLSLLWRSGISSRADLGRRYTSRMPAVQCSFRAMRSWRRMKNGEQGKEMTNSPDIAKAVSW